MGKEQQQSVLNKYKDMADIVNDFDCISNNRFLTPTMGEMIQEDLMTEILDQQLTVNGDETTILDAAYYNEEPFTTVPGYYPEEGVFILKAYRLNEDEYSWTLNKFDGDTTSFKLSEIEDGNSAFTMTNNKTYESFKDYYSKTIGGSSITIRNVGIDAPEIPHLEIQSVPKSSTNITVEEMTFGELKKLKTSSKENISSVVYLKYIVENRNNIETAIDRNDKDKVKVLKLKADNKVSYYEILQEINGDYLLKPFKDYQAIKLEDIDGYNKNYSYYVIVSQDDTEKNKVVDGYKAKRLVKKYLSGANVSNDNGGQALSEIILMLDARTISMGITTPISNMAFNSLYYVDDLIGYLVEEWNKSYEDIPQTNHKYSAFGTDAYGRCLGAIYVKQANGGWMNLAKRVIAEVESSIIDPDFNEQPELQMMNSGLSDIFNLWSYRRDNFEWADSFDQLTRKSYQDKIDLHRELTGIDFTTERDCALFIGDTLMLLPPESIRNITQSYYERVPNMRSKGTMAKNKGQNEHMLEITLYFYEDAGINGIARKFTTPSGEEMLYYMNGLRSLIAQFKIAPFLPIENGYINDILGIEAVALQNLSIQTVEGTPRLLKAVLTLREFNYRTFMPDVPLDDPLDNTEDRLSIMQPMFAKCFNWELFRYYYQRSIIAGENLENIVFPSYAYNYEYYSHKNSIGRWDFCNGTLGSTISIYIPDENWLNQASQIYIERQNNLYITPEAEVELSNNAKLYLQDLSYLYANLSKIDPKNVASTESLYQPINNFWNKVGAMTSQDLGLNTFTLGFDKITENTNIGATKKWLDVLNYSNVCVFSSKNAIDVANSEFCETYIQPIVDSFYDIIGSSNCVNGVTIDETIKKENDYWTVVWTFKIGMDTTSLTAEEYQSIKEVLAKSADTTSNKIFIDDQIRINFSMKFKSELLQYPKIIRGGDNVYSNSQDTFCFEGGTDYNALSCAGESNLDYEDSAYAPDEGNNAFNYSIDYYVRDYKNPANMPYVAYLEEIVISKAFVSISNSFTNISLKAVEGIGSQYLGGQDTQLELELITSDNLIVAALNQLPTTASAMAKKYKRVIPAWPIKIKSELTDLLGVSEVVIDTMEVSTVQGFPGVYSIAIRLTSVDRTQRQQEALRKLDVTPTGGNVNNNNHSNLALKEYMNINETLSKAELYPDLDLPTIEDLAKKGWRFVKYSSVNRVYPDPDFYITYAYPYSSLLIKKMVKDSLAKQLLIDDTSTEDIDESKMLQNFTLKDTLGTEMTAKLAATFGLEILDETNSNTTGNKTYSSVMEDYKKAINEKIRQQYNLTDSDIESLSNTLELANIMTYLTVSDVNDGWEIRPGWRAPLAGINTNISIKDLDIKSNLYAEDVKKRRSQAIKYIDNILKQPLKTKNKQNLKQDVYFYDCINIVNEFFCNNADGKSLLKLLCPSMEIKKINYKIASNDEAYVNSIIKDNFFEEPDPLCYIAGYLFAAGCALSGQQEFSNSLNASKWSPNHFAFNSGGDYEVYAQDDKDVLMPFVEVERAAGSNRLAKTLEQANKNGIRFGAWRIGKYSKATIEDMTNRYDNSITYSETDIDGKAHDDVSFNETYKDKTNKDKVAKRYINNGFIDPYYNYLEDNTDNKSKEELYNYKEAIAINIEANAEAFLRNMLVCMRRLILDGLLISELDIIVENHNSLTTMLTSNPTESDKLVGGNGAFSWAYSTLDHNNTNKEILEQFGFNIEEWEELLETIKLENKRSVCARLIYPFLTAITENSPDFYSLLLNRDYDSLENMIGYVDSNTFTTSSRNIVLKFLYAISGIGLSAHNEGKNTIVTSASQKIMNSIIKDVYIKASEDPRMYLLHSFYDMLVNDKRGRLVRAFPTYYAVFVDEGRKIGSWKLHDNFYNMNSIAEIQVVKSRKIAADTCTLIMNNTFNSYTDTADSTTSQLYVDVYGLKDVFNSIFSPRAYFEKEKSIRLRQQVTDKVLLTPGVRIHVRVGYSADGSKLPIVFNGKVAEVGAEDVVQIVAQGDGHELMNPLSEFGDIEVTALDASQSTITWGKDIRGSLSKGGETPRDLLAKLLTATHGGWKKAANKLLDGRWFNDNPFGLVHFGDKKFNEIFDLGEPVQNLYEVSDASLLKGVNEISATATSKKATPIINTSLMDKTFWDLLHLAASTGLEYIGAVRDFGFRSTIFLGRPNHYYAYDYVLVDNKIVEKRKPFQQFHYYDSYNDIIYNGIKASESQMKTNAIGLWQSSKMTWGREQATVGPIYLDMNIYPEYQKSMTVDTGLLAAGDGGIDLGILNHFSEKWSDINDNKVNESTAWRVTANALRNSVKDMYQGDMAVIGDPSIKPYDRCYIYDTYENMMGQFEVEAVIHTMSVSTGFTTSIMPDVIARHEDYYESSVQNILNTAGSFMGGTFACTIGDILLTRDSNKKLLKAIAKNKKMYGVTSALQKTVKTLSNKTGLQDILNAEGNESYKQLFEEILQGGISNSNALELSRYDQLITDIAQMASSDIDLSDIKNLSKTLSNIIDLDEDTFDKAIKEALENDKWGNLVGREEEIDKAVDAVKKNLEKVKDSFNNIDLDYKDIKKAIVDNAELYSIIGTKQKKILEQWANGAPEDLLSDLATLLEDADILKAIDNGDIEIKNLDSLTDGLSDALKLFKNDEFIKAIRGGDIVEDVMKVILKVGTKFNVASIALSMVKATVGFVFTNNIKEMLYKTLQGVQAIDVYPLKKHGKPLTAGMAGHKGSVAMYPVADGYNSIQGMIMQVAEWITEPTGSKLFNDALMGVADFFLDIDEDKINTIFADWKSDLGIDTDTQTLDETSADLTYNVFNDVASAFAASPEQYYYLISKPRKTSFNTNNKTDATYLYYEIKDVGLSNISTNEKVKDLYWLENDTDILTAMTNGKFKIVHNEAYDSTVNISFEDGTKVIPVMIDNSIIDTPLVQEEALYIIKRILRHDKMNKTYGNGVVHFKSGARLNDTKTWKNTGFSFILEYQGLSDGTLDNILKEIKEDTTLSLNDGNQLMFTYQRSETVNTEGSNHGDKFVINVYPPIQSTDGMR